MSPSQAMTPPPAQSGASMGGEPPMAYSQGQPQQPQMSGGSPQDALLGAAFANAGAGASYGSNAQNVYDRYGSQDATGGIMGRLGQYMQDPNLEASIGAAKSDIYRDLKENGLTQLDGDAAMNGNVNSSRTGVAEGLLKRGAMDRAAQVDAGMRENAYTRALGAAQEDYFGGARTAMEANNQVGQAFQMGQQGMMGALGFGNALYQGQMGMGNVQQQDAQNRLNANRQQYEYLNGGYQNNALNQYLGQTGGQQWGSASAKPNTGLGQSVAGGALAGFGAGGPWGAVLGGGLGALGSLF